MYLNTVYLYDYCTVSAFEPVCTVQYGKVYVRHLVNNTTDVARIAEVPLYIQLFNIEANYNQLVSRSSRLFTPSLIVS